MSHGQLQLVTPACRFPAAQRYSGRATTPGLEPVVGCLARASSVIADELGSIVADGELTGAVTIIWQDGRVVDVSCVGWQHAVGERPVRRDTLFRIASMTKPISSTVALMLFEDGRFSLDEPITEWAPEMADLQVRAGDGGPSAAAVLADRDITFGDLLRHRSGITCAEFQHGPFAGAYAAALGSQIDGELTPDQWIARLGGLPLVDQPGNNFHYGHSRTCWDSSSRGSRTPRCRTCLPGGCSFPSGCPTPASRSPRSRRCDVPPITALMNTAGRSFSTRSRTATRWPSAHPG